MSAVKTRALLALFLFATTPALAVGLGPLSKSGLTDSPQKGFYLTVINPYRMQMPFTLNSVGWDDEQAMDRVKIVPASLNITGGSSRRVLVIAQNMTPGESYPFRVCAQLAPTAEEGQTAHKGMLHARVCSKLIARRLP